LRMETPACRMHGALQRNQRSNQTIDLHQLVRALSEPAARNLHLRMV
jgi:hypothetical protein